MGKTNLPNIMILKLVCVTRKWCQTLSGVSLIGDKVSLTLSCSANERTEMKLKIYLSEAWMCSEFGYQLPMSNKKGLKVLRTTHNVLSDHRSWVF